MGPVRLGPDQPQEFDDRRARTVDVGNPHLVLLGPDTAGVEVAELGPKLQAAFVGGINVEWITVTGDDEGELLDFRVFERGADAAMPIGQEPDLRGRQADGVLGVEHDQEVVARTLVLGGLHLSILAGDGDQPCTASACSNREAAASSLPDHTMRGSRRNHEAWRRA